MSGGGGHPPWPTTAMLYCIMHDTTRVVFHKVNPGHSILRLR